MRISLFLMLLGIGLYGQDANPLTTANKGAWTGIKNLVLRAAEKMPEEHYSFKPAPEVRSFGQIVGHVADAHYLLCSPLTGQPKDMKELVVEKTKSTKADLIAALKESITYCDAVYDSEKDANAASMVKMFGRERPRLAALSTNIAHDNEHYGNLVTYMRIKGLVPPSSEPRQAPPPAPKTN